MNTLTKERLNTIASWRKTYGDAHNVMIPAHEAEELVSRLLAAEVEVTSLKRERETMHSIEYVRGVLARAAELEAQLATGVTAEHQRVIGLLLGVCGAAFELADDSCQQEVDGEMCHVAPENSFQRLCDWLDEIENTLPDQYDDLPNTILQWGAVPRHALRALLQSGNSPVEPIRYMNR
ncbi:hypothetical protein J5224_27315, partial [Candidatus Symbiopectobacterium sp. NZEC135]|nr:hypothetical protein [Candidatus Symbiopectobacterium sp. NZEC135]